MVMAKKGWVVLFVLLLVCGIALAGDESPGFSGRGYFMIGGNMAHLGDLNSELKDAGYPSFEEDFFTLGVGGFFVIKKVILGGEGFVFLPRDASNEDYTVELSGSYGVFNIGYMAFSKWGLDVYPLLGIGGYGFTLEIYERGSHSFDDILDDPRRGAYMTTGGFTLLPALGVDYLFDLSSSEKSAGGIVVGLRAGYAYSPVEGDWRFGESDVSNAPAVGLTGPFVFLTIGAGGGPR